jgi:hypothetical protein
MVEVPRSHDKGQSIRNGMEIVDIKNNEIDENSR